MTMNKAIVELSSEDINLIAELGQAAETIQQFMELASTAMATSGEEQDSITYMCQQILKGILILNKLRPAE